MFKKLKMWFWNKNRIIKELIQLNKTIDLYHNRFLQKIEELDQNKVYFCSIPGATIEDIRMATNSLSQIGLDLKWTMPKIIISNMEIKEKTKEREK